MSDKRYSLGINIGKSYCSIAAINLNIDDEPVSIDGIYVKKFTACEVPKTGKTLASELRSKRTVRRILRRKNHRKNRVRNLLQKNNISTDNITYTNIHELRALGLDKLITKEEFAAVLMYFVSNRGYKHASQTELDDSETGRMLSTIAKTKAILKEGNYRTPGEAICKDSYFRTTNNDILAKNKDGEYHHIFTREQILSEITMLFEAQRELGNTLATKEVQEEYISIFSSQRHFEDGPGNSASGKRRYSFNIENLVGQCSIEKNEKCAPKGAYTTERHVLLTRIATLNLIKDNFKKVELTNEQRDAVYNYCHTKKEVTFAQLRKFLKLTDDYRFNLMRYDNAKDLSEEKKEKFAQMTNFYQITKALGMDNNIPTDNEIETIDMIACTLSACKSDDKRIEELKPLNLTDEQLNNILKLNMSRYGSLSIKAMRNIAPYLKEWKTFPDAYKLAGYDLYETDNENRVTYIKGDLLNSELGKINDPRVKRAVSQTIQLYNAVVRSYNGVSPVSVSIVTDKELGKSKKELDAISKKQNANRKFKEKQLSELKEIGFSRPSSEQLDKYRLWKLQEETDLFSGEHININELMSDKYTCGHIVPYSISFNDSIANKVIIKASINNQREGYPLGFYAKNILSEEDYNKYSDNINQHITDYRKKLKLLKETQSAPDFDNLTIINGYTSSSIVDIFKRNIKTTPYTNPERKQKFFPVNRMVVTELSYKWKLNIDFADKTPGINACIAAVTTPRMIQNMSRALKRREYVNTLPIQAVDGELIDTETGEVLTFEDINTYKDTENGFSFPEPYDNFANEIKLRLSNNPAAETELLDILNIKNAPKEVIVVRKENHRTTGAVHKETIYSTRWLDSDIITLRTPITALKYNKETGEIEDYCHPEDDKPLYNALCERLKEFNGDAQKAFEEPFFKPTKDGKQGPLVKKVKIIVKKVSNGVPIMNGIAANYKIARLDLFRYKNKKGETKYTVQPLYMIDVTKKEFPSQIKIGSKYISADEAEYITSMWKGDLIHISREKPVNFTSVNGSEPAISLNEAYCYITSFDNSSVSIKVETTDGRYQSRMTLQSIDEITVHRIDNLGNISKPVKSSKRLPLNQKNYNY